MIENLTYFRAKHKMLNLKKRKSFRQVTGGRGSIHILYIYVINQVFIQTSFHHIIQTYEAEICKPEYGRMNISFCQS